MTWAIKFDQVTKHYAAQCVLDDISFSVAKGEYVGLIGANGAGKTTLMKSLLDLTSIDTGTITLAGIDHQIAKARASLAYLPERFVPPHFVTGQDFLLHMARTYSKVCSLFQGQSLSDVDTCYSQILTAVDFDPTFITKPVRAMSKGMVQKIGLAAMLISDQDLLLLDEPMSGLDPKARVAFKNALLARRAENKTLFFSTHLLPDVESLCDRIIILHEGQVRYVGSPTACCAHYKAHNLEAAYISCIS